MAWNIATWLSSAEQVVASLTDAGLMQVTGLSSTSDVDVTAPGHGVRVAEGTDAKQGTAALSGGTVVVANKSVTSSSRILLTTQAPGGTPGAVYVSARTPGTSFTITSTSGADTSTVAYFISEPG